MRLLTLGSLGDSFNKLLRRGVMIVEVQLGNGSIAGKAHHHIC